MNVTFGSGNRIVIPKEIRDSLNLQVGTLLDISIKDGNIVLSTSNTGEQKDISTDTKKDIESINKVSYVGGIKIASNLEEGSKYSSKYYSPCKLVIRTKNSYLRKFCDRCKGLLTKQYNLDESVCPYISKCTDDGVKQDERVESTKTSTVEEQKSTIAKIPEVVKKPDSKTLKQKQAELLIKEGRKSITPISSNRNHFKCKECGEFYEQGFLVNDVFYCKGCTVKNFKKYFIKLKKFKEEM